MSRNGLLWAALVILFGGLAFLLLRPGAGPGGMADGDFARLVALSAWGLVLGASVLFMARSRPGQMLRHAGIWGLVFLALIGLYAFAEDFRGVGARIQAALLPGSRVATGGGEVMVTRGYDNHFRIPVEINGTQTSMLVDTGASIVAIDRDTASDAGIDVGRLNYSAQIRTANGVTSAAPVRLDSVRVGDIERRNVQAVVTQGEGIGIGLLGMSFLGELSSVEFRGDRMILND